MRKRGATQRAEEIERARERELEKERRYRKRVGDKE